MTGLEPLRQMHELGALEGLVFGLAVTESLVEGQVLAEGLVGVEAHFADTLAPRLLFGEGHELAAEAASLVSGDDGYVLDEEMTGVRNELEDGDERAFLLEDPDLM